MKPADRDAGRLVYLESTDKTLRFGRVHGSGRTGVNLLQGLIQHLGPFLVETFPDMCAYRRGDVGDIGKAVPEGP